MNPALFKLMALQSRGMLRRMTRGAGTPMRMALFALGALLFVGWLGLVLLSSTRKSDPNRVRAIMPLALLGICIVTAITSAGDKAVAFTPGEVDQLFPGPFTRRELLAYKLIKSALLAIISGLVLSLVLLRHARWWPASFVGVFLSLLFVQWFAIVMVLAGQTLGMRAYSRIRKGIMIGVAVLVIVAARSGLSAGVAGGEKMIYDIRASPVGRVVLAPFDSYGRAMTATSAGELLKWASYAGALNAGMLFLVFMLDAQYIEAAMVASERRYAKIQRIRAGSFLSGSLSKTSSWHLPQLPWLGGAGPIIWRQTTSAARSARGLLLLLLVVAVGASPVLAGAGKANDAIRLLFGVMAWLTFLCSSMLNFDFRGDVDHIESLKSLPLRELSVAAAQLVVPIVLLTMFHLVLLCCAAITLPKGHDRLLAAAALSLPFNAILFAAENLVFLLFPTRPAAVSPGDFQILGRKFIFLLMKGLVLGTACIIALFPAVFVWQLTGKSLAWGTSVGWIVLALEAMALVPLIALAYRRFDPSLHAPA